MNIGKYERKAFPVEAVQVTKDNFSDVAEWCGGEVVAVPPRLESDDKRLVSCVRVPISSAPGITVDERHYLAFVNDWVVRGSFGPRGALGWKIYRPQAFRNGFYLYTDNEVTTQEPITEDACGKIENTLDHKPCVLGAGHLTGPRKVGCRSFQDYLYA